MWSDQINRYAPLFPIWTKFVRFSTTLQNSFPRKCIDLNKWRLFYCIFLGCRGAIFSNGLILKYSQILNIILKILKSTKSLWNSGHFFKSINLLRVPFWRVAEKRTNFVQIRNKWVISIDLIRAADHKISANFSYFLCYPSIVYYVCVKKKLCFAKSEIFCEGFFFYFCSLLSDVGINAWNL